MSIRRKIADSLSAISAKLAGARHANNAVGLGGHVPTLTEQQIDNAYRNSSFARQVVSAPVGDALRNGRTPTGTPEQNAKIFRLMNDLKADKKVEEAYTLARLYGMCTIFLGTRDGRDLNEPLDVNLVREGGLEFLTVMKRTEFANLKIDRRIDSPTYGEPEMYFLAGLTTVVEGDTSKGIHPSRFAVFRGDERQTYFRSDNVQDFLGDSVLQSRIDGINKLESAYANIGFLMFEAKTPSLLLDGATDIIKKPGGLAELHAMANTLNVTKGNTGVMILDRKTMEYKNNPYNFTGLPPIIQEFAIRVAGEADIPLTRLFNMPSRGLNATGEGDMRIYQDRLLADQKLRIAPPLELFDQCVARGALGNAGADIVFEFNPLYNPNQQERIENASKEVATVTAILDTGVIQPTEVEAFLREVGQRAGIIEAD